MNARALQRMKTAWITGRALVFGSLFLALWWWIATLARRFDATLTRHLHPPLFPWSAAVGAAFMLLGAAVTLSCAINFIGRGHGTPAPFDPPRKLVAAGAYNYCRNPMYIGFFLLMGGLGLCWQSPAVLVLNLLAVLGAHILVTTYEEPHLRKIFGSSYLDYCKRVPRWIPKR
jgi:protein-S-isoprenylcysteine O-methyltransferase Ste14